MYPKENSEFCFPEILNVPPGNAEADIEVKEKQNCRNMQSLSVLLYFPTQEKEKTTAKK